MKTRRRAGLAHGDRLPTTRGPAAPSRAARLHGRGLRLHDLHRQRGRPAPRSTTTDRDQRPDLRVGALGQPQLRGAHPEPQGQLPGASPPLVVAYAIAGTVLTSTSRTSRSARGRTAGRLPARHLADVARDRRGVAARARDPRSIAACTATVADANPIGIASKASAGLQRPTSTYIQKPPFFDGFALSPAPPATSGRARARHLRRLGHDRPHLAGRRDQGELARGQVADRETACPRPISTAAARAAATTR